ncbi:MAG: ion transporter [Burkholderiales bacterium]|jgi:voltage-gated sodium channel|nr:ion transporter [Burkholderiales bacterium]MDP2399906.1 ion transporter [Burkholderiales bacterium]
MTSHADSPKGRARLAATIEAPHAQSLIITLILVNAVILGLETSPTVMANWGGLLMRLDQAILAVFVIELVIRLIAHGWRFFRDPWSVFDFIVITIALLPASGPFAVLRALRVLRVLRLLTMVPNMRRVVGGLLAAIPGLASVFGIISIIFYVAAVIATKLFGGQFPDWFGTLGSSAYTLFQVMTLESWSMGIVRPVMEVFPQAWIFFVLFILISTFTMLNLFIAVIVNAIQTEHDIEIRDKEASDPPSAEAQLRDEVRAMRDELQDLRRLMERQAAR